MPKHDEPERRKRALVACAAAAALAAAGCGGDTSNANGNAGAGGAESTSASTSSSTSTHASTGAHTSTSTGPASSTASTSSSGGSSSTSTGGGGAPAFWMPDASSLPWQWEIDHAIDVTDAHDMGTDATLPSGGPAPAPVVYDIDAFDNPASAVAALHGMGFHVICYVEVGAVESYRPDHAMFPPATLGNTVGGYPMEHYLDVRDPTVLSVVEARIDMCADKGFDAVEPDIDDSYTENTGFPLTKADEETFLAALAAHAHGRGLAWGLKNGDATDGFATDVLPHTEFVLDEQCNQYSSCGAFSAYTGLKAVFQVEYQIATSAFCDKDDMRGWNGVKQNVALAGGRSPCE